jgi:hypothetical protein
MRGYPGNSYVHVCDDGSMVARGDRIFGVTCVGAIECVVPFSSDRCARGYGNHNVRALSDGVDTAIADDICALGKVGSSRGCNRSQTIRVHVADRL